MDTCSRVADQGADRLPKARDVLGWDLIVLDPQLLDRSGRQQMHTGPLLTDLDDQRRAVRRDERVRERNQ